MSDAVSAMGGAAYDGIVRVEELGLQGMITLRGDLSDPDLKNAASGAAGVDMPGQGEINSVGDQAIAWMSPDELLVMTAYAEVEDKLAQIHESLKGHHFLAANVSDARALFQISGSGLRDVLAKLFPVDLSAEAFGPGRFRRSRMAQIPAAFWMPDEQTARIVCFRSVAEYAFNLLQDAAAPGGEVGLYG